MPSTTRAAPAAPLQGLLRSINGQPPRSRLQNRWRRSFALSAPSEALSGALGGFRGAGDKLSGGLSSFCQRNSARFKVTLLGSSDVAARYSTKLHIYTNAKFHSRLSSTRVYRPMASSTSSL